MDEFNMEYVPRITEEHEYAACLLTTGGPDMLHVRTIRPVGPISSIAYMRDCEDWYSKNISPVSSYSPVAGVYDHPNDFHNWWSRYKRWLVEARYEHLHK